MLVKSVSFGSYGAPASKSEHKKLDKLAKEFTSGSVEDQQLVTLAHDVFEIRPWYCSEGASFKDEDLNKANSFMDAMRKGFEKGNSILAYALGKAVLYSPAGRADNCDFDDLPIGKIKTLRTELCEQSMVTNEETGIAVTKPEYVAINRKIDSII